MEYHNLVEEVLQNGNYKENRTSADTISLFNYNYEIDLENYPLLTTKKMDTFRWDSMLHEFEWYMSGEHHVRDLTEKTSIWDAWADQNMNLPSAYGRFWRRYPVPESSARLDGEAWFDEDSKWVNKEEDGRLVFDQLQYVVDALNGENDKRGPNSRRLVVNAWHPSNAQCSSLPPCHYSFVFNVQNGELNTHLTQRSGDVALGIPFNIAAYALMTKLVAKITELDVGTFAHSIVDAHIYCGKSDRGSWYKDNISWLQNEMQNTDDYREIRKKILQDSPEEPSSEPKNHNYGYDHVPGLLEQLSREPLGGCHLEISDCLELDTLEYDDFRLEGYESHGGIRYSVAE